MSKIDIHIASEEEIKEAARILNQFFFPYTSCKTLKFDVRELEVTFVAKENNEIVGLCYADKGSKDGRTRKTVYIGYFVVPDAQSKGVGTMLINEMVNELKKREFVRVECDIVEENTASRKLIEKFGFKLEGILKKRFLTDDGRLVDDCWYGKIIQ